MSRLRDLLGTSMLGRTAWMLLSYLARFGFQGIAFVLIARALGTDGFGAFAATLALITFLSPFVELGAYTLIVRDITARVPVGRVVGSNLALIAFSLPVGLLVACALKFALLPSISWTLFLSIALAIFLGGRLSVISSAVNVAKGLVWRNVVIEFIGGLTQTSLALILFLTQGTVEAWGWMYLAQYLGVGLVALFWAIHGQGVIIGNTTGRRVIEGLSFATANSASGAYNELDKTLLQRFSDLQTTGLYAAGFRVMVIAALPIVALLATAGPKLFEKGSGSPQAAFAYALRLSKWTVGYGVVAFIALWFIAPWLPLLLGDEFASSSGVVRFMAAYVLLQGLQYPLADALTVSGLQNRRTIGQICALCLNLCLNLLLIPKFQWQGAAIAAMVTQLWLWLFFSFIWWLIFREKDSQREAN